MCLCEADILNEPPHWSEKVTSGVIGEGCEVMKLMALSSTSKFVCFAIVLVNFVELKFNFTLIGLSKEANLCYQKKN